MESIFHSIILGIVQGLGEFLPISSTAHLILVPYFFGWPDPGLAFDVALHVGTLIAVLAFFWQDWAVIFKLAFKNGAQSSKLKAQSYKKNILWLIAIATIPGVLAGYFLENQAETFFRSPSLIALTLSSVGFILYIADKKTKKTKDLKTISKEDAMIIGAAQALAIIPGVSRSGATITAALFSGFDRVNAARFSFLLSTPIIFGAAILKLPHLFREGINVAIIIGILASAVSGYLAIKYLLKLIEKIGYKVFFWYRLALAFVILTVYMLR
jgi:undecaprenyl-diphosphatase